MSGIQDKASVIITGVKKIFGPGTAWWNPIIQYQGGKTQRKQKQPQTGIQDGKWVQWLKAGNNN